MKKILLVSVVLGIILLFTFTETRRMDAERFYTSALTEAGLEVGGNPRLSYALALVQTSPLMSLAGEDIGALEEATANLRRTLDFYISTKTSAEEKVLLGRLYPFEFLEAIAQAESARRTFIATQSLHDESTYNASVLKAIEAYEEDLTYFINAFEKSVPEGGRKHIAFEGVVTRLSMLNSLKEMQTGIKKTRDTFLERRECLQGDTKRCNPNELLNSTTTLGVRIMSHENLTPIAREVVSMVDETKERSFSYLVEVEKSRCAYGLPQPHLFGIQVSPTLPPVEFVGDLTVYPEAKFGSNSFAEYLRTRSVAYIPILPANFYQCPNAGSDYGRIFTALYAAEASSTEPEVVLALKNQSVGISRFIQGMVVFGETDQKTRAAGIETQDTLEYYFLVRSAFPTLFLTFNPSVVEHVPSIVLEDSKNQMQESLLLWSSLREDVSRERMVHDLRAFFLAHVAP